ncbi:transposase [Nocardia gipuzkoensis]
MPRRYPEEFRRKVLDLVAAGRPVAQVAADLGISDQTIYLWRQQETDRHRPATRRNLVPSRPNCRWRNGGSGNSSSRWRS